MVLFSSSLFDVTNNLCMYSLQKLCRLASLSHVSYLFNSVRFTAKMCINTEVTAKDMYQIVTVWTDIVPRVYDEYPHLLAE